MSEKDKIKDIQSLTKLLKDAKDLKALSKALPFLENSGIKNQKISEVLNKYPNIYQDVKDFVNLPDRFNDHFSEFGWVAYESLNTELMKDAINLADAGNFDDANDLIVEYYDEDNLEFHLNQMKQVEEFLPRWKLAEKAKEDYLAERYHACVPVALIIIDGVVNDIERIGFYTVNVDLTAWDSVAGHSSGLQKLCKLFNSFRNKTNTKTITVPYRNGILHGWDLSYANKIVAAKTWAALFAIRDWALAIKDGKKCPTENESEPSLSETVAVIAKNQKENKKLADWKPRKFQHRKTFQTDGPPDHSRPVTPERQLALFFEYWMTNNYGKMAGLMKLDDDLLLSTRAGQIRTQFEEKTLKSYSFLEVIDMAAANTIIKTEVEVEHNGKDVTKSLKVTLLYVDSGGRPVIRGEQHGDWRIIENSFMPIFTLT